MSDKPKGFWASLQGILTGIAALITAITGLYIAINNTLPEDDTDKKEPKIDLPKNDERGSIGQTEIPKMNGMVSIDPSVIIEKEEKLHNALPDTSIDSLVDCKQFTTVNTVSTLMSWSDYHQNKIVAAKGSKTDSATRACYKTIDYRGMAHCKEPNNMAIRQSLFETLTLCRVLDIEWTDVKQEQ